MMLSWNGRPDPHPAATCRYCLYDDDYDDDDDDDDDNDDNHLTTTLNNAHTSFLDCISVNNIITINHKFQWGDQDQGCALTEQKCQGEASGTPVL